MKTLSLVMVLLACAAGHVSAASSPGPPGGNDADNIMFSMRFGNGHFNSTTVTGTFHVISGHPAFQAVVVNNNNFKDAVWAPYDGIIHLNLGPTDGVYKVWLGLKARADGPIMGWVGTDVYLDRVAPDIIITNPTNRTTASPRLQVQGCAPEQLEKVWYDLSNAVAVVANQQGSLKGRYLDTTKGEFTTNYFQCYDIPLANGLNQITVHAVDKAGNASATNLNITLDYAAAGRPVVQLTWPQDGMQVYGTNFTLRGRVDDPNATAAARIVNSNGDAEVVYAQIERDGKLWVEDLPLSPGTNRVTLSVTNFAGLSSVTNLAVVTSTLLLTIDPVTDNLWLPMVKVTGHVGDPAYAVWVNGVKATVNQDGTWLARRVPVSEGGTASFDLQAFAPNEQQPDGSYGKGPP